MIFRTIRAAVALLCATAVVLLPAVPAQADQTREAQWHLRYLKIAEAHKISQGEGVTVAVIDTGVDPHPDLRNNLRPGTDTSPNGTSDGRIDSDANSHGTGMAGLIAAHGRGNNGALGIAPKAKIIPIRYEQRILGDTDNVAKGIEYAVTQGVKVISISIGGGSSPLLREAVDTAIRSNVVVVAAAGNVPGDFLVGFPAAYPGVVSVGATDRRGEHAKVSVTGPEVTLLAPGVDIRSTAKNGQYRTGTGTSDSTAIVAGAVALIRSKYPDLSAEEVVHRLTATAVDKGKPGRDDQYGYGVLDLVAALSADVPPLAGATPSANPSVSPSPSTRDASQEDTDPAGNLTPVVIGGVVLAGLALAAGLVFWLVRRTPSRPRR